MSGKYLNSYTSSLRFPVELVYYHAFTDINQAIAFEKKQKKGHNLKKGFLSMIL